MAINLIKGENINLTKQAPNLVNVMVGLGWEVRGSDGDDFDLDASAFLLKDNNKVRSDADFIFYNQLSSQDGSVEHTGDNRVGGDGANDDEQIMVHLDKVADYVKKIAITVTIYDYENRKQNFGQVNSAYIRIVNADTDTEIARYDLSEDASVETAMIFGELYKHNGEWKFKAVGQGFLGGLKALCQSYGVNV